VVRSRDGETISGFFCVAEWLTVLGAFCRSAPLLRKFHVPWGPVAWRVGLGDCALGFSFVQLPACAAVYANASIYGRGLVLGYGMAIHKSPLVYSFEFGPLLLKLRDDISKTAVSSIKCKQNV
jgi:hypothetical protein